MIKKWYAELNVWQRILLFTTAIAVSFATQGFLILTVPFLLYCEFGRLTPSKKD